MNDVTQKNTSIFTFNMGKSYTFVKLLMRAGETGNCLNACYRILLALELREGSLVFLMSHHIKQPTLIFI